MDIDPIYSSEQICIPPDLADVLKAYTKEVIRQQSVNLIEFSAIYFANLANMAKSVKKVEPPSKDQLRLVLSRASGDPYLTNLQISGLCQQVGIALSVISRVMEVGSFAENIDIDKFLFLMLAMGCASFSSLVTGMFDVWGDNSSLDSAKFTQLVGYLGPDIDRDINAEFLTSLEGAFTSSRITLATVMSHPLLQSKFDV